MANNKGLIEIEINTLLDWLDKIRIGLLLGFNTLNRNELEVKISFHIKKGIGLSDRMVIINRVEDTEYFLSARGCDTLLFRTSPNCFLLLINNIYLLSISTNQLISKRLGFPYYDQKFYEEENNKFTVVMKKGNEGMMLPLIRKSFILKGVELYQPMFPQRAFGNYINYYESDYVKKRSLDWENGIGRIFVNKNRIIRFYDNEFDWLPKISSNKWDLRLTASKQVFQTQIDLVSTLPSMDRLSGKRKAEINYVHKLGIQSNKRILEIIDNKLW